MTTASLIARRDFLRLSGIVAGSLAATPAFAATAETASEVPRSRTDRLATGANVCRWFRFPLNNSGGHFASYISLAEADYMAHIGLKHVRLCIAPRVIMNPISGETVPGWFHDFGEVLAENRIGWAVWGWDEGFGLNRKMENGKPVVDAVVAQALGLKAR